MNDEKPSILETIDTFIACVEQSNNRAIVIYRRQHGGREYVRFRTWHKHRDLGVWYPDKYRKFVVPLEDAAPLAQAMIQAAEGKSDEMPDWLAAREREQDRRIDVLKTLNAPPEIVNKATRRRRS